MGTSFTARSASKIASVVRKIEGTPNDNTGGNRPLGRNSIRMFWAKITGSDTLDDGRYKYSWVEVFRRKGGQFIDSPDATPRSGDLDAGSDGIERYAINDVDCGADSPEQVPNNSVVKMWLDYDLDDSGDPVPLYTFSRGGGGIPQPTAKYQVYTPIDDTLKPTWTSVRMGP